VQCCTAKCSTTKKATCTQTWGFVTQVPKQHAASPGHKVLPKHQLARARVTTLSSNNCSLLPKHLPLAKGAKRRPLEVTTLCQTKHQLARVTTCSFRGHRLLPKRPAAGQGQHMASGGRNVCQHTSWLGSQRIPPEVTVCSRNLSLARGATSGLSRSHWAGKTPAG
jgi:hypothetical protein